MPLAAALLLVVMTPQDAAPAPPPQAAAATELKAAGPAAAAIAAGQAAFKKRRFRAAQADFEKAVAADPQSAAAASTWATPTTSSASPRAGMNENKEKAKELFAKAYTLDPAFVGRPARDWRGLGAKPPAKGGPFVPAKIRLERTGRPCGDPVESNRPAPSEAPP